MHSQYILSGRCRQHAIHLAEDTSCSGELQVQAAFRRFLSSTLSTPRRGCRVQECVLHLGRRSPHRLHTLRPAACPAVRFHLVSCFLGCCQVGGAVARSSKVEGASLALSLLPCDNSCQLQRPPSSLGTGSVSLMKVSASSSCSAAAGRACNIAAIITTPHSAARVHAQRNVLCWGCRFFWLQRTRRVSSSSVPARQGTLCAAARRRQPWRMLQRLGVGGGQAAHAARGAQVRQNPRRMASADPGSCCGTD